MASFDLIDEMDSQQAWSKARRSVVVQRVLCAIQDCSLDLIPFEEARQLLHLNQKICRGLQEIELDKIRGSVGRYQDFTSAFLPRRDNLRQRWQRVWSARVTKGLPPIELYKVGQAYFVSDGNHRVSTARMEGMETIEAYVCEYISPLELSGEADLDEVLCKAEYAEFLRRTQLQPDQEIVFTVPGRYMEIECQIRSVQQSLENERSEPVSYREAAALWYGEIYSPTVREIRESGALERFPGRTAADLFIWMWQREPELQIYCAQTSNSENEKAPFNSLRSIFRKLSTSLRRIFL
ncbi:MAG: transcriptional regulator [Anaerolineales bacterium]